MKDRAPEILADVSEVPAGRDPALWLKGFRHGIYGLSHPRPVRKLPAAYLEGFVSGKHVRHGRLSLPFWIRLSP